MKVSDFLGLLNMTDKEANSTTIQTLTTYSVKNLNKSIDNLDEDSASTIEKETKAG